MSATTPHYQNPERLTILLLPLFPSSFFLTSCAAAAAASQRQAPSHAPFQPTSVVASSIRTRSPQRCSSCSSSPQSIGLAPLRQPLPTPLPALPTPPLTASSLSTVRRKVRLRSLSQRPSLGAYQSHYFSLLSSSMAFTRLSSIILVSAIFRLILILYGEWQDTHMEVRYTDVDYLVFSDAASLMASGKSPFQRSTYRYSPLLAFLLMPNTFIHRSWGKFLFSASDLLVSFFINAILKLRGVPENLCVFSVICWLFNPFTFTIGTRGNCEPIVCAMVLWILLCLMNGRVLQAAFWYGLIVHFRIYPVIYSLPILLILDPQVFQSGCRPALQKWSRTEQQSSSQGSWITRIARMLHPRFLMRCVLTRERILFGLISGAVFLFCTAFFFCLYGWDFLHEALLYHLTRTDPRHNFSVYFYHIYLQYERKLLVVEKLISFLPQFIVQLVLILSFAQDLPFCFFVQTVAFVAFNKVVTAQYFVWFFCLLPLVLPWSNMKLNWKGLLCIIFWVGAQLHWLMWGYLLEFKGKNVFLQLWMASILFLAANTYLLISVIRNHRYSPVFTRLGTTNDDSRKLK